MTDGPMMQEFDDKPKHVLWVDSWYPDAYRAAGSTEYYGNLFHFSHGTSDYWDHALEPHGYWSTTLIDNVENVIESAKRTEADSNCTHDFVCSQNIGKYNASLLRAAFPNAKIIGFCSYAAEPENLRGFDVLFTSFRWLASELSKAGENAVYLPLAFGKQVLDRVPRPPCRDLPLTFIGGVGEKIWSRGTQALAELSEAFPDKFKWWGYKVGQIPQSLERTYQGEAYGYDYWRILMRSQITINRHGEIARGESPQNMRSFEGPGAGTFTMSELPEGGWQQPGFYFNSEDLIYRCRNILEDRSWVYHAEEQHKAVMEHHCYENRVPIFLDAINNLK